MKKRAVLLFGAGASVEYGVPSTAGLTDIIYEEVLKDSSMINFGGNKAFEAIKAILEQYLSYVNFEQIYHCAHELIYLFEPTIGAVDEYRPLLYPFIKNKLSSFDPYTLRLLAQQIIKIIFVHLSSACNNPDLSLQTLTNFIRSVQDDYITRIYTTNYDDLPWRQSASDLYIGFKDATDSKPRRFDIDQFWNNKNIDSIFHLHGSIHMSFWRPQPYFSEIGELFWYADPAEALKSISYNGSGSSRQDGSEVILSPLITGLDKLSRLQQRPFSHFYSALAEDLMQADIIYVLGSGLSDLHLNTWLNEARSRNPKPKILFISKWNNGSFINTINSPHFGYKEGKMLHDLKINIPPNEHNYTPVGSGWTVSNDRTAAVWDRGFQAFLNAPDELRQVLELIK